MSPVCRGPLSRINPYDRLVVVTFNSILISRLDSLRSTYVIASHWYTSSLGTYLSKDMYLPSVRTRVHTIL